MFNETKDGNMKKLYLICNAHIDPSWQWVREEGMFAAITTFSAAADFCEEFGDGFVFNHNEAMLYMWIEKYAPALFARIKRLVAEEKWHIMGGWYLQPDVVMSDGESVVRQILKGRKYFREKFGVEPKIAVNFDSFGHSAGLAGILRDAGYEGYVCMRPDAEGTRRDFVWRGLTGEKIPVHRLYGGYNSFMGKLRDKLNDFCMFFKEEDEAVCFWGIGNHGGGPSRVDYSQLMQFREEHPEIEMVQTTPEGYFSGLHGKNLLEIAPDAMNFVMQGTYTSQIRVKQAHQRLENCIWKAEKIAAYASATGFAYPKAELDEAICDLLYMEFHDILPGSGIRPVEEQSLRLAGHGEEIAERVITDAFLHLAVSQPKAGEGEFPILVCNPHPFSVAADLVCEFMLPDQNRSLEYEYVPEMYFGGKRIDCQIEKEYSNVPIDWRKRVSFCAQLRPFSVERFSLYLKLVPKRKKEYSPCEEFTAGARTFVIDFSTGEVRSLRFGGEELLGEGAFSILCVKDVCDSWGFDFDEHNEILGAFSLASPERAGEICGVGKPLPPVRLIERGKVRSVVECVYTYGSSYAVVRYILSATDENVEMRIKLFNTEKDVRYRLRVPFGPSVTDCIGKTMYGVMSMPQDCESVSQEWNVLRGGTCSLGIVKFGNYGGRVEKDGYGITLMRAAGYCAHPFEGRPILPKDRYSDRMEQGERDFRFVFVPAPKEICEERTEKVSTFVHQAPVVMNCFPLGGAEEEQEFLTISNDAVSLAALKRTEDGMGYALRLFNPTPRTQRAVIRMEGKKCEVELAAETFKTVLTNGQGFLLSDILERRDGKKSKLL